MTPWELRDVFGVKRRIAVVGNASSLLGNGMGTRIDGCDLVVRFNGAPVLGFEGDVGMRTDLLVTNVHCHSSAPIASAEMLAPRAALCLLTARDGDADVRDFEKWLGAIPVCYTLAPDPLPAPSLPRFENLTSGTYAISFVIDWLLPMGLFLAGFSHFRESAIGHYWGGTTPPAERFHPIDTEREYLRKILGGFSGDLELAPDVARLLADTKGPRGALKLGPRVLGRIGWVLLRAGMFLRRAAYA